jgi:hypothetical protein
MLVLRTRPSSAPAGTWAIRISTRARAALEAAGWSILLRFGLRRGGQGASLQPHAAGLSCSLNSAVMSSRWLACAALTEMTPITLYVVLHSQACTSPDHAVHCGAYVCMCPSYVPMLDLPDTMLVGPFDM